MCIPVQTYVYKVSSCQVLTNVLRIPLSICAELQLHWLLKWASKAHPYCLFHIPTTLFGCTFLFSICVSAQMCTCTECIFCALCLCFLGDICNQIFKHSKLSHMQQQWQIFTVLSTEGKQFVAKISLLQEKKKCYGSGIMPLLLGSVYSETISQSRMH